MSECAYPWRDDDFAFFYSPVSSSCALNQNVHYGLTALWLAFYLLALLESIVANIRRTDMSRTESHVVHWTFYLTHALIYAYIIARPYATVRDGTDGPVLLTLLALRVVSSLALSVTILRTVVMGGMNVTTNSSGRGLVVAAGGAESTSTSTTAASGTASIQSAFVFMNGVLNRVLIPMVVVAMCLVFPLFTIAPNVMQHEGTLAPWQIEAVLKSGWVLAAFTTLIQVSSIRYITHKLRLVIHESVLFAERRRAIGSGDSSSGNNKDMNSSTAGSHRGPAPMEQRMINLEIRMAKMEKMSVFIVIVFTFIYGGSAGLGMRYWIFHVMSAQSLMSVWGILTYHRLSVFSTFMINGSSQKKQGTSSLTGQDEISLSNASKTAMAATPTTATKSHIVSVSSEHDEITLHEDAVTTNSVRVGTIVFDISELEAKYAEKPAAAWANSSDEDTELK